LIASVTRARVLAAVKSGVSRTSTSTVQVSGIIEKLEPPEMRVAAIDGCSGKSGSCPSGSTARSMASTRRAALWIAFCARDARSPECPPMPCTVMVARKNSGQVQHYYWHPIRCAFGNPSLDVYELRHF
jgi:hypothetical protein